METNELRYPALDGLRGMAALMVLIAHSSNAHMHLIPSVNLTGMGPMGLWLFFVLSAFLLTEQALKAASQDGYASWSVEYLLRRFFRIFPLFAFAVGLDLVLDRMSVSEAFDALTLVSGKGIFWTIPPEFHYYFFIPFVALLLGMSFYQLGLVSCGLLIIISLAINLPLAVWPFMMLFVTGSMLAYATRNHPILIASIAKLAPASAAAVIAMIPVVMTLWLPNFNPNVQTNLAIHEGFIWVPRNFSYVFGFIWAPVIFACVVGLKWTKFLASAPMRYIGQASFGLYLLHPVVIDGLQKMGFEHTVTGGLVVLGSSIAVAAAAHHILEEPLRRMGYRWARSLRLAALKVAWSASRPTTDRRG